MVFDLCHHRITTSDEQKRVCLPVFYLSYYTSGPPADYSPLSSCIPLHTSFTQSCCWLFFSPLLSGVFSVLYISPQFPLTSWLPHKRKEVMYFLYLKMHNKTSLQSREITPKVLGCHTLLKHQNDWYRCRTSLFWVKSALVLVVLACRLTCKQVL